MPNESDPEKKFKIRPRGLERDKEPPKTKENTEAEETTAEIKKHKWENRLRQSGKKFPAKNVSKALEDSLPEPVEVKISEGSVKKTQESPFVEPVAHPKPSEPEGWESPSSTPDSDAGRQDHAGTKSGKAPVQTYQVLYRVARKRVRLVYAIVIGAVLLFCSGFLFWNLGIGAGRSDVMNEETKEHAEVPKEFLAKIDGALEELRNGDADKASKKLQELEKSDTQANTPVASLTYLLALAAMQNGETDLAGVKAAESIAKHERISDSLALEAVLETQKSHNPAVKTFGDPRLRSELLLRQAILADAANPFPMIELATLLRYQKRTDEAQALLRAARSRLNPVDSHTVVDITIALSDLEQNSDDKLPEIANSDKDFVAGFSAAYVAMRKGDFDRASGILETLRQRMAPDLFYYLINDPALRRYAREPKLQKFFQ